MLNQYQQNNLGLGVDFASLLIGYINLIENEQQSRYNDVHAANDRQAEFLLQDIHAQFEEQNKKLDRIIELLENMK